MRARSRASGQRAAGSGQRAAEFDYRVKQQALHLNGLIDAVSEVKQQLSETGIASE